MWNTSHIQQRGLPKLKGNKLMFAAFIVIGILEQSQEFWFG